MKQENIQIIKNQIVITRGIFNCRDSAGFSVSASNKLSFSLTGQCFEIGNKNIPPTVIIHHYVKLDPSPLR